MRWAGSEGITETRSLSGAATDEALPAAVPARAAAAPGGMRLRAVVADPQPGARDRLRSLLSEHRDIQLLALCESGHEAVDAIRRYQPDVLLTEVALTGCDAFDVIHRVGRERMPPMVFVSGQCQYAVQAFDVAAVDFVPKPIAKARLHRAIERLRWFHLSRRSDRQAAVATFPERFLVRAAGRLQMVAVRDIDVIDGAKHYSRLHVGHEVHLMRSSLRELERVLEPRRFARVHRSFIVNLERVEALFPQASGVYRLQLSGGRELTLSRKYRQRIAQFGWRPRLDPW